MFTKAEFDRFSRSSASSVCVVITKSVKHWERQLILCGTNKKAAFGIQ